MTTTLQEQLLRAIKESEENTCSIARHCGMPDQVLRRFVTGQRSNLTLETASKLASYFGMRLTASKRRAGKGGAS